MTSSARESRLVATFVSVADSLVAEYDIVDLLQILVDDCTELFDASAAGILLVTPEGALEVVAATNERSEFLSLLQARSGEGPCVETITIGRPVSVPDVSDTDPRWSLFASASLRSGYRAIHSIPMRLRDSTIGSLNLFRASIGRLNEPDAVAVQALADVATIAILNERAHRESDQTREQLQRALDSRIVIEQAKGVLSQRLGVDMGEAFGLIRAHSRSTRSRMRDVAGAIVSGRLHLSNDDKAN